MEDDKKNNDEMLILKSSVESNKSSNESPDDECYLSSLIEHIGYNYRTVISGINMGMIAMITTADGMFEIINFGELCTNANIDDELFSILLSIISVFQCLGCFLGCLFSAKYGRILCLQISLIFFTLFSVSCSFIEDIWVIFAFRCVVNINIGMFNTLSANVSMEYTPCRKRSLFSLSCCTFAGFGPLYIQLLSWYFHDKEPFERFSYVNFLLIIPHGIAIFLLLLSKDSAYTYLLQGKYEEVFKLLEEMGSSKQFTLTDEMKQKLKEEASNFQEEVKSPSIKELFKLKLFKLTMTSFGVFFLSEIIQNSTNIVPITLEEWKGKTFNMSNDLQLIMFSIVQIPSGVVAGVFCEMESLGRKGTIWGTALISVLIVVTIITLPYYYCFEMGLLQFISLVQQNVAYLYIQETYPCHLRDYAVGIIYSASTAIGSWSPFMLYPFQYPIINCYYVMIGINMIAFLFGIFLPYETRNKKLSF